MWDRREVVILSDTVIVALVSFAATLITSLGGYKLIAYRVEQLERKVEKHNGAIERVAKLERRADVADEKQVVANHRIDDLENDVKRMSA